MTWQDLILDALVEIGAYNPNDPLQPDDAQQGARRLNRILDSWAANRIFAYSQSFVSYTLTPNNPNPYLIGPNLTAPNFATPNAAPRPVRIDSISLILNNQTPAVDLPMNRRDKDWWANERVKGLTTSVPTDYYYEPDFPSGSIFFWPVPTYAYGVRCELWTELGQAPADLTQTFVAPPGYALGAMLTLAEHSCTPYTRPVPEDLPTRAAAARRRFESNNAKSPRIQSVDWGTQGRPRGDFNYFTGLPLSY